MKSMKTCPIFTEDIFQDFWKQSLLGFMTLKKINTFWESGTLLVEEFRVGSLGTLSQINCYHDSTLAFTELTLWAYSGCIFCRLCKMLEIHPVWKTTLSENLESLIAVLFSISATKKEDLLSTSHRQIVLFAAQLRHEDYSLGSSHSCLEFHM